MLTEPMRPRDCETLSCAKIALLSHHFREATSFCCQGHSKNAACDEGDDLSPILAEVFAGLGHGHSARTDEIEDKVADNCERAST